MAYCGPTHYKPVAEWISASSGYVPPAAVQAGYDSGDTIYVGRAHHNGDTLPGKLMPSHGCVYVPWGGEEHSHRNYEILCNPHGCQLEWRYGSGGDLLTGAVQGGATADGEPLYIGRHEHEGTMTVGKIHPSHGCLYIAYGGQEHSYPDYEILVCRAVCF